MNCTPKPWIVGRVDGKPLTEPDFYEAEFLSEEEAVRFLESISDVASGNYYLDGPSDDEPFPVSSEAIDTVTLYGWPTFDGKIKLGPKDGNGQVIDQWPERIIVGACSFSVESVSEDQIGYDDDYGCRTAVYYQDGHN